MNELQELFLNSHGEYKRQVQFNSLIIISIIIMFFSYYYDNTQYAHIIVLILFALYIANKYVISEKNVVRDFNEKTMYKLNTLQSKVNEYLRAKINLIEKTSGKVFTKKIVNDIYKSDQLNALYIDATLIDFLFSIVPLYEYNPQEFYLLLKGANNILNIRKEIEEYYHANEDSKYPENIAEMLEIAIQLKSNTINNVHNFIYTVPKIKIMNDYVDKVIQRYGVLISRNVNIIYKHYKNNIDKKGINISTKFVSYNTTKPFDEMSNHSSKEDKLISFYI